MSPSRPNAADRDANIARVANHHAEAILAHVNVVNGLGLDDAGFDKFQQALSDKLIEALQMIDVRVQITELPADDPAHVWARYMDSQLASRRTRPSGPGGDLHRSGA
jgi:hypothetical protein